MGALRSDLEARHELAEAVFQRRLELAAASPANTRCAQDCGIRSSMSVLAIRRRCRRVVDNDIIKTTIGTRRRDVGACSQPERIV